ncbi:response regulator [Rhizobium sp. RAF56]|uniref:response regulator n=1 Tax=Rhizobium sp. RAF56 TaxID=3233062 RepID=UPI003F965908
MPEDRIAVLVVEDEALLRMSIVAALEDEGFEVLEASNAAEAIATIEKTPRIHALFTDIDMPGTMDGLLLAAFVRDRWPPIKIVVTSGHRIPEGGMLPVDGAFLPKPYNPDNVIASIRELVCA